MSVFLNLKALAFFPLIASLSACVSGGAGGGSGSVGSGSAIQGPSPSSTGCTDAGTCTYGATSSKLAGVGVLERRTTSLDVADRSVSYARVNLDVPGDSVSYSDSAVNFSGNVSVGDIKDPDSGIIAQNTSGSTTGLVSVNDVSGYEFVKAVIGNTQVGVTPYMLDGYVGFVTDASVVPTSGSATYNGSASGGIDRGGLLAEPLLGSVSLTANFGGGNVDMVADFHMARDGVGLVEVSGMTINGNTFSGGDLKIYTYDAIPADLNKTLSNVLGTGVSHQAAGVFYGVDAALALKGGGTTVGPDEIAGAVVATGNDAELYFDYVAD